MDWLTTLTRPVANATKLKDNERAFFDTDLALASAMAKIASQSKDRSAKRLRTLRNARRAYDAILHFRYQTHLPPDECKRY